MIFQQPNCWAFLSRACHELSPLIVYRIEHFSGVVQGTYEVKFLIDGEWRLAAEWPTKKTLRGETNNIIVVE